MEIKIDIPQEVYEKIIEAFETDDVLFENIKDYIGSVYKSNKYKIKDQQISVYAKSLTNEDDIEAAKISITKIEQE